MIRSSLFDYFAKLSDPRLNRNKKHNLADIIVLSILAVICGAESWDSIEEFGKSRIDFLKKILYLPNGIPSHDTINRVFSMLKPDKFEVIFISWVNSLRDKNIEKEIISIDGKTIPELLELLDVKGSIVTIDAIGTQRDIAKTIIDNQANYILALNWGVENSLHWTLDMTFREDEQRKRDKNSAQNFAIVRKIVLNLLKQEDSSSLLQ